MERVGSVYLTYDTTIKIHYLNISAKGQDASQEGLKLTFSGDGGLMKRVLAFWVELFNDLGCSVSERTVQSSKEQELVSSQTTGTGAQGVQIPSESANHWLCSCGTVNKGNFCMKCGNKCETGTPLWICSCGNLNKGKFCSKCGSPRKE